MVNPALPVALLGLVSTFITERDENHGGIGASGSDHNYRVGDFSCPGVDVDAYREACRAVIFRDAWNRWRLLFTSAHGTTEAEVKERALALLGRINKQVDGKIRRPKVWVKVAPAWGHGPALSTRLNACDYPMTLRASDNAPAYWEVWAEFVYRGVETHIPWVATNYSMGVLYECPTGADWLLDAVLPPSQVGVPSEESDSPLPPNLDPKNEGFGALTPDLDFSTKLVIGGAGLLAVAVLAGYAIRSVR